jgi:hypothetical protein
LDIKFDEFEDLIKFGLFTSKEVALFRVSTLQVSIVGRAFHVGPALADGDYSAKRTNDKSSEGSLVQPTAPAQPTT